VNFQFARFRVVAHVLSNTLQVMGRVSSVSYVTGNTLVGNLSSAFQVARTQQFVSGRGDRVGAPNIIIALINGGVDVDSRAVSLRNLFL